MVTYSPEVHGSVVLRQLVPRQPTVAVVGCVVGGDAVTRRRLLAAGRLTLVGGRMRPASGRVDVVAAAAVAAAVRRTEIAVDDVAVVAELVAMAS